MPLLELGLLSCLSLPGVGCPAEVPGPFLGEFHGAAGEAPLPVLLGGHSLVAGGLMLLTEAAWREEDRRKQG